MPNLTNISEELSSQGFTNKEEQIKLFTWLKNPLLDIVSVLIVGLLIYKLYLDIPVLIANIIEIGFFKWAIAKELFLILIQFIYPIALLTVYLSVSEKNSKLAQAGLKIAANYTVLVLIYVIVLYILLLLKSLEYTADNFKNALYLILGLSVLFLIIIRMIRNAGEFFANSEKVFDGNSETNPTPYPLMRSLIVVLVLLIGVGVLGYIGFFETDTVTTFYESINFLEVIGALQIDLILIMFVIVGAFLFLLLLFAYSSKYYVKTAKEARSLKQKWLDFLAQAKKVILIILNAIKDAIMALIHFIFSIFKLIYKSIKGIIEGIIFLIKKIFAFLKKLPTLLKRRNRK